jgi:hypothetical protein
MPTDKFEDFILQNRDSFDDEPVPTGLWERIESHLQTPDDGNNPLEAFIATNRDAFDESTPPPRLEGRVFAAMDEVAAGPTTAPLSVFSSRKRTFRILGIAASFLLLLLAAFSIGNSRGYRSAAEEQMAAQLRQISPELAETEDYYRGEIAAQFTKVDLINNDPQLRKDLAAIDEATEEIRTALVEVPVSQRAALVDQLIENYRTKLNILLRIQQHATPANVSNSTTQSQTNDL